MRPNILDRVADRLEQGWTQGFYSCDANGVNAQFKNHTAVSWCFEGALLYEAGEYTKEFWAAENAMAEVIGTKRTINWNDNPGRTQAEVVEATRKAAELLG